MVVLGVGRFMISEVPLWGGGGEGGLSVSQAPDAFPWHLIHKVSVQ
jgi:hypothetical protein